MFKKFTIFFEQRHIRFCIFALFEIKYNLYFSLNLLKGKVLIFKGTSFKILTFMSLIDF